MVNDKKNFELFNEKLCIISSFGQPIETSSWFHTKPLSINIFCHGDALLHSFKYMKMSFAQSNEILDYNLEFMASFLQSKLEINFSDLEDSSRLTSFYIGRIRSETLLGKGDNKSLLIEGTRFTKSRPHLDFSELTDYFLFPGQLLAFKGVYKSDDLLTVKEIIDPSSFILPFSSSPITLDGSINIFMASGPFTLSQFSCLTQLHSLLMYIKQTQPHLLIIYGPFTEPNKTIPNANEVFIQAMNKIEITLSDIITEAIVIPSSFDLNHFDVFPTPPYEGSWSKIRFFANPCLINISGLILGCCSTDIFLHLTKQLVESTSGPQESGARIKKLCQLILSQHNFYPLYPANNQINLEISKLTFCKFNVTPHLIIIPSMLKNFVKSVNGCLFINPEKASKNMFTRIKINVPENHIGSIENFVSAEIVMINQ